jgi:hypothetical protein
MSALFLFWRAPSSIFLCPGDVVSTLLSQGPFPWNVYVECLDLSGGPYDGSVKAFVAFTSLILLAGVGSTVALRVPGWMAAARQGSAEETELEDGASDMAKPLLEVCYW